MHTILFFFYTLGISAPLSFDVYSNERETRRPADEFEHEIALDLGGCTGTLIAPNIGLSAGHCRGTTNRVRSGVSLFNQGNYDGQITRTIESLTRENGYDYWIFEIRWQNGETPIGMRLVPYVQTESAELQIGSNESAEKIYTIGFPADVSHGRLIHCWGYGKKYQNSILLNNISLINGNSGGGILREYDNMQVSIVSGGPNLIGMPGWKGADWNNPRHWNQGVAFDKLYARSATLKDIFPGGRNRFQRALLESPYRKINSFPKVDF